MDWTGVLQDTVSVGNFVAGTKANIASAALLYYDYFLTLSDEVHLMWGKSHNLSTIVYFVVRYGALLTMTIALVFLTPGPRLTQPSVLTSASIATCLHLAYTAAASAFIAARIMALWSRNWCLGVSLFVLGLINSSPLVQLVFFRFYSVPAPWPLPACLESTDSYELALAVSIYVPAATSAINMAYEILCFSLTVAKTYKTYRAHLNMGTQTQLTDLLLRDGSLYFLAMIILGVFNIVSSTLPNESFPGNSINDAFSRSLVAILITRFIVNLTENARGYATSPDTLPSSTVRFRTATERFLQPVSGQIDIFSEGTGHEPNARGGEGL
ncbi:hypothetical protein C8Q78DRAFT_1078204 [Trametes maxima]|nr:hypothetical protein C8Q78DRAFT_1078204 [Trametes maxima]